MTGLFWELFGTMSIFFWFVHRDVFVTHVARSSLGFAGRKHSRGGERKKILPFHKIV
jgi:hypothetical protein